MRSLFVTLDMQTSRGSSAKSEITTEQVHNKALDAEGGTTLWPLFWPKRKRESNDDPPSPFAVECISTPQTGKDPAVRPVHGRGVIKNVRKLLSRIACLSSPHTHPVTRLQVFMEVRRETFYDSGWDVVSTQEPLGPGRVVWDDPVKSHSSCLLPQY